MLIKVTPEKRKKGAQWLGCAEKCSLTLSCLRKNFVNERNAAYDCE